MGQVGFWTAGFHIDILDTRNKLQIPGTSSTIQPGNYNCDSCNIVYLLICSKCDSGYYIGETSNRLRLRLNNHKKSIRDNSRGFPVAVNFNQPDHTLKNVRCAILKEATSKRRQTDSFMNKRSYINSKHIQKV